MWYLFSSMVKSGLGVNILKDESSNDETSTIAKLSGFCVNHTLSEMSDYSNEPIALREAALRGYANLLGAPSPSSGDVKSFDMTQVMGSDVLLHDDYAIPLFWPLSFPSIEK